MVEQKNILSMYNLPKQVKFCKTCTISNQRLRINIDEHGICSACRFAEHKKNIRWSEREKELKELCDRHRKKDGSYDVIVPCSGGKDGGFVAHLLKYKYGMNPLTVTWAPYLYTDIGRKNLENFIRIGGFDNVLGSVNGTIHRKLSQLAFLHMGDNFQPFIYGQTNFPLRVAVQYGVSLIMYGENGEVEYGGDMKNAHKPTRDIIDHDKHYFSGKPPEFWESHGVTRKDLYPYLPPEFSRIMENKTEIHFMSYYHHWDPQENFYYCVENTGFEPNSFRSEGTYSKYASLDDKTDGQHYYLSYIKFGIGRATSDSAHEIRDGKITRDEGILLVKKYDGEFPKRYFKETLEYLNIDEEMYWAVLDSWRSPHLWQKIDEEWELRHVIWHESSVLDYA
jgi:N-acetyl sugar amidotransferase